MRQDPESSQGVGSDGEDADLIERLAKGLEELESGKQPDVEMLCEGRPELVAQMEAALCGADELPDLHVAVGTFDPMIGRRIGDRYELRSRIGSGGMGVVYEAEDHELQRVVVLKMMRPEFMLGDELQARFDREAQVLASIEHAGIVSVYDRGRTEDGQAFLVMARLRGRTAGELIEEPPQTSPSSPTVAATGWLEKQLAVDGRHPEIALDDNYIRQVVRWTARVARALHAVHRVGVVHRDVKPSNIFIQSDGNPVLVDFGLVTFGPETTVALRDVAVGTPAYMAPEQLDPSHPVSVATDVYGLTASLYHLLTFDRPYQGSPSQVLAALQHGEPVPAVRKRPGLPRDMQAILDTGMARDAGKRYSTACELAEDLEAWLDYRPVRARPVSGLRRFWRRTKGTVTFRRWWRLS